MSQPPNSQGTTESLAPWLRLQHTKHCGIGVSRKLLAHFGDLALALSAPSEMRKNCGIGERALRALQAPPDQARIELDLAWAALPNHHILSYSDPRYPASLHQLSNAPLLLYLEGDIAHLDLPRLAMVGSRNPTREGRDTAYRFARHLAGCGLNIVSGLARGIDAACHLGALDGGGVTLAVAATGLDTIYPKSHVELAQRIASCGLLLSELPIGTGVHANLFARRNRIISGLSLGLLVTEASTASGSLITASHALEQGREVFAVPGSIHQPQARGCHQLIKQGAKLVERADEVLEELVPHLQQALNNPPTSAPAIPAATVAETDPLYRQLLECLQSHPKQIDELVEMTGLSAAELSSMLLILELNGQLCREKTGAYSKSP